MPPVTRAINLLRYIGEGNRCRNTSRAAADLGINRTTLFRLLHTLERERLIEADRQGGGFILSFGLVELAAQVMGSRDVVRLSRPVLARLALDSGLSSHLGVLSDHEVIVLIREAPEARLVSNIREGSRLPAHATVMGRMILAHMPAEEVRAMYSGQEMAAITDKTATDLDSLMAQLGRDRDRGIAWSVANYEEGIGSCAGIIRDHSGAPVAAISVSGPQSAFDEGSEGREKIGQAVAEAARKLSAAMGYAG